jgi:CIC family chloride channel protein
MTETTPEPASRAAAARGLVALALIAALAGVAAGLVGALFRLSLDKADALRGLAIARAHGHPLLGLLLVVAAAAAVTALAAWLVRRFAPAASGSGIPHVEAVLGGELPPVSARLIPIKFAGGVLAIGSGLALGREGPSVQMGASAAHLIARLFHRSWADCRALIASGAGAGLATAFNAPVAGAIFVLEELVGRFEPRTAVAALGASFTAIAVARTLLGEAPDFSVAPIVAEGFATKPLFLLLGFAAGLLAILYNRSLLATLALADRVGGPVELRAAAIGGTVGLVAWFAPDLVGGGDNLTQQALNGAVALAILPAVFLLRLALGAASYAAATPGGLFAPMLVLGAQAGLGFGLACDQLLPGLGLDARAFAVVGMAAFFTGVVRAPLTGIALVTEMTGSASLLLPMLGACFGAMLVPTLVGDPPVYDSLRCRAARTER